MGKIEVHMYDTQGTFGLRRMLPAIKCRPTYTSVAQ